MKLSDIFQDGGYTNSQIDGFLAGKVDKVTGKGLSQEDFTTALKEKLDALDGSHYKGYYENLVALESAIPAGEVGDYADVDGVVVGEDTVVARYYWDSSDWVMQIGETTQLTATQIKTMYESNPDTNAYTDADKALVTGAAQADSLGTAADEDVGFFATAAQGAKADSALQPAATSSSNTIDFTASKVFGTAAAPLAGNLTNNLAGAKLGIVQKIYHSDLAEPELPDGWVNIGGQPYTPGIINRIYAEWCGGTTVEFWVNS